MKLIACILLLAQCVCYAQSDESKLEKVLESINPEARNSMQIDEIEALAANPVPLTKSSLSAIASLPGFNAFLAEKIVAAAASAKSISEICQSLGLSEEQRYILELCTRIEKNKTAKNFSLQFRGRAAPELNSVRGLQTGAYRGDGWDATNRLRAVSNDFAMNILTNKNKGEPRAAEQLSGNLSYTSNSFSAVAGDFVAESGMGAILSKPMGSSAGTDPVAPVIRYSNAIRPYTGSYDLGFFRGIAAKGSIRIAGEMNFNLYGFASSKELPGTLDSLTGDVLSVYSSAYYRTPSEIAKKRKFTEKAVGGVAEFSSKNFTFSANVLHLDYSRAVRSESQAVFAGSSGLLKGISAYGTIAGSVAANAEAAFDASGNPAYSAGVEHFAERIKLGVALRYFSESFRSPYGYNFGSTETPANESGIYAAATWKPDSKNLLSASIDIFRDPAAHEGDSFRGNGIAVGMDYESRIAQKSRLFLRFRLRDKSAEAGDSTDAFQYRERSASLRGEFRKVVSNSLTTLIRADFTSATVGADRTAMNGSALTFGLQIKPLDYLSIASRGSVYSTDGYQAAVWVFDGSLPGMLRTVALYGSGLYWTVDASILIGEKCRISLKYFENSKFNTSTIGTGNDEIQSGTGRGMFIQIDLGI